MYRESIALFRQLIFYVVLFSCVQLALDVVESRSSESEITYVPSIIVWSVFSYLTFATILTPFIDERTGVIRRVAAYVVRDVALALVTVALATLVVVLIAATVSVETVEEALFAEDEYYVITAFVFGPLFLIAFVLIYSLFGTILPDSMVRHRQGFGASFGQGKWAFRQTAGRLIAGPAVVQVVRFLMLYLAMAVSSGGFPLDLTLKIVSHDWQPNYPVILILFAANSIFAFSIIMIASVLSKTYLATVEKMDVAAVFE